MDIDIVFVDVDGTLTDGRILYTEDGRSGRFYSVLDGHGFQLLRERGIYTAFLTASDGKDIDARAKWLDVPAFRAKDKLQFVEEGFYLMSGVEPVFDKMAYFADDIMDIHLLERVAMPGCPLMAHDRVKKLCHERGFISAKQGGHAAFRDFAEFLISRID